mmetsp:Transcript_34863/g.91177  ORF Transcript_34863/g.91177 Transcript_34863/m.91177 type:complete len:224 (-) Transcript_34863:73-744(-)
MREKSSVSLDRMLLATSWICSTRSRGSSPPAASASSVTSEWMPIKNHRGSPVRRLVATVSPWRSSRLRKSSPDLRWLVRTPVHELPVRHASLRCTIVSRSFGQPSLRILQLLPNISTRLWPVIASNFSDTAISGMSRCRGFATVTQKFLLDTAAVIMAWWMLLSSATRHARESISRHWRLKKSGDDSSWSEKAVDAWEICLAEDFEASALTSSSSEALASTSC